MLVSLHAFYDTAGYLSLLSMVLLTVFVEPLFVVALYANYLPVPITVSTARNLRLVGDHIYGNVWFLLSRVSPTLVPLVMMYKAVMHNERRLLERVSFVEGQLIMEISTHSRKLIHLVDNWYYNAYNTLVWH